MTTSSDESPSQVDRTARFRLVAWPLIFGVMSLFIGLFFLQSSMGDPDSYRRALSALTYIEEGTYSVYWDSPLTMYLFAAGTRLANIFDVNQLAVLNTMAVLLGAVSVWPFYQLVRTTVNWQTAVFATIAYVSSPALIRFSTYLSHEIVGFAFALWSVYLFEQAVTRRNRLLPLAFGVLFGGTFASRTNGAAFIVPALLALLFRQREKFELPDVIRLLIFSLLGFAGCLLIVYRPETVLYLVGRSRTWFSTYYGIGQFVGKTTLTALESLTPALVGVTIAGIGALIAGRMWFIVGFGGVWILTVYAFYVGMIVCRLSYFLVVLPPCLLLAFAGADQIEARLRFGKEGPHVPAKLVTVLFLLFAGLGPNLAELNHFRRANDDKVIAEGIAEVVGPNLLFTTSLEPMIKYYNRENSPETVYLVTEHTPGTIRIDLNGLRLAQDRLQQGRPVFSTAEVIPHLKFAGVKFEYKPAWQYKSIRLFRITGLKLTGRGGVGPGTG